MEDAVEADMDLLLHDNTDEIHTRCARQILRPANEAWQTRVKDSDDTAGHQDAAASACCFCACIFILLLEIVLGLCRSLTTAFGLGGV